MHHAIWIEHDGSWTWSIEEGKAFEDGHKVLARDDGFPTRGDAKEDMQKAWAKLLDEGKQPGRPGGLKSPRPAKPAAKAKTDATAGATAGAPPEAVSASPEWAVVIKSRLVAVFVERSDADAYCTSIGSKDAKVTRAVIGYSV